MLQEHKLAATGIIDPATARKLGEIAGVQVLVTGTLTPFGDAVRWTMKALDTATAQIFAVATTEIPRTKGIEDLLSRGLSSGEDSANASKPLLAARSKIPMERSALGTASFQPRESHQFSFALIACKQISEVLTCSLQITNRGQDRQLSLATRWQNAKTRAIDALGHEVVADSVSIGTDTDKNTVHDTLTSGVPMLAEMRFSFVPFRMTSISLLEITCLDAHSEAFGVQFRDVSVD